MCAEEPGVDVAEAGEKKKEMSVLGCGGCL